MRKIEWLRRNPTFFAEGLEKSVSRFTNNETSSLLHKLAFNDFYLSGYAYAIEHAFDDTRYICAFSVLEQYIYNYFGVVNHENDLLALYLVDNNVSKVNLHSLLKRQIAEHFDNNLKGNLPVYTSVEAINSAGLGVAILTLDELPDFLVKFEGLVNRRKVALQKYLEITKKILENNQGKDIKLNDPSVSPELKEQLIALAQEENLTFLFPYGQLQTATNLSLYSLNAKAQSLLDFFTENSTSYETSKTVYGKMEDGTDVEISDKTYRYTTAPLGLLYVLDGYLYNLPKYYAKRAGLIPFMRALNPQTMFWCDLFRQTQRLNLEDLTSLVVRKIYPKILDTLVPYYARLDNIGGNKDRVNLTLLNEYQDLRNFVNGSGVSTSGPYTIRLSPSKFLSRIKGIDGQLLTAFSFAVRQRKTLIVTDNMERTVEEVEALFEQAPELRNHLNFLNIISAEDLTLFRTQYEVIVILKEVKLDQDLLPLINSSAWRHQEVASPLIIYGTDVNKLEASYRGDQDSLEKVQENLFEQQKAVLDFLRNRRMVRRNNLPVDVNFYYTPTLSATDTVFSNYFDHQEQRNWNSQLSSDKFLTVRLNNLEISYYPNLNGNLFALAGVNRNFFTTPISGKQNLSDENISGNIYHLNLDSGDLISNLSIAIHRLISLFTERKKKVSHMRNVSAFWVVSDSQAALLPVYAKLFTNIFNKEENAGVVVKQFAEIKDQPLSPTSILAVDSKYDQVRNEAYDNVVAVVEQIKNNFVANLLEQSYHDDSKPGFSSEDSTIVDQILNQDIDSDILLAVNYISQLKVTNPKLVNADLELVLDFYENNKEYFGETELILLTRSDYLQYCREANPDVIVIENCLDLYKRETASEFAEFVKNLFIEKRSSLVFISSPEPATDGVVKLADITGQRIPTQHLICDLPTSDRYAYGINFNAMEFKTLSDKEFKADGDPQALAAYLKENLAKAKVARLEAFDLPISAYNLPQNPNPDYYLVDKGQLEAKRRYGYIPALGEKALDIYVPYLDVTKSKVVNAALSILLQPRNNKTRGLVVVNNAKAKEFLAALAPEFGFVVHDYKSIELERAVFSHAVVIADPEREIPQAVIQQATLLARGFKSTGSVFLLANMQEIAPTLGFLALDSTVFSGGLLMNYYPPISQLLENPTATYKMLRVDFFSPYYYLEHNKDTYSFVNTPSLNELMKFFGSKPARSSGN
ncbi:hypothetical protein [Psittacicella hinzii]|nr:hypothetical protein [Psittacicella hinzii]